MNYYLKSSSMWVLLLFLLSCEDIINEINIENDSIELIAPFDGAVLMEGTVQFDWQSMEGASTYRIQIARPNFNNPEQIIFNEIVQDSLTTSSEFTIEPGTYQWRVRGENGAYLSPYTTSNLIIN